MAALAAALLDELMGRNRNALPTERTKELTYNDAEVRTLLVLSKNFSSLFYVSRYADTTWSGSAPMTCFTTPKPTWAPVQTFTMKWSA